MDLKLHTLTLIIIVSIIAFAVIYHLMDLYSEESNFNDEIRKDDFIHKLWISTSIQATSGWSRNEPRTSAIRLVTILQMLVTIFVVLYFASYISIKND